MQWVALLSWECISPWSIRGLLQVVGKQKGGCANVYIIQYIACLYVVLTCFSNVLVSSILAGRYTVHMHMIIFVACLDSLVGITNSTRD